MPTTIFRLGMGFFALQGLSVATLSIVQTLSAAEFTAGFTTVNMAAITGSAKIKEALTPATTYAD